MTLDEIKLEREQLERAIAERQRQIDRDRTLASCAERDEPRRYVDYTRNAQGVVTKSAPARQSPHPPSHGERELFTKDQLAVLEPAMAAVGQVLNQERQKAAEAQRQMREEMQDFCRREVDRMAQRLRNEMLQDKLDQERMYRQADQQRRHRGVGLPVSEMIEINPNDVN